MNTYLIEHKIRTLAEIWTGKPFVHDGYEFRQWDFLCPSSRPLGHAWIAKSEMYATSVTEAINTFRAKLFPIVDRIAAVSQCYTVADFESFLILRMNSNPGRIFLLRYSCEREPVPLPFNDQSKEALDKLDALGDKLHALSYLRAATNASSYLTRLTMLLSTLEALAGERPTQSKRRQTDMEFIRTEILKDDKLYDRLYSSEPRLRHAVMHGHKIDLTKDTLEGFNYIDEMYRAIVSYLNNQFGLQIDTGVIDPQRIPHGTYEVASSWFKPSRVEESIDLQSICDKIDRAGGDLAALYDAGIDGLSDATPPEDY